MARIPQPREIAELKGAIDKNPQRYRNEVPKSDFPLGPPPDEFTEAERKAWIELESYAVAGVLTLAERPIMELTARLIAQSRENFAGIQTARISTLVSCLARLGLTPADRQKVGAPSKKDEDENPFNAFQ